MFGFLLLNSFVYGVVAIVLGGIALSLWSRRPVYAVGGAVLIGFAALPITASLGCPAVACTGVKQLHVFFEWTLLGPSISTSFDAGRCAYICPHRVELIPLTIGYLSIGEAINHTDT